MCVIAIKDKNTRISYKTVKSMYETNPDGAGIAILKENKTIILKGYMSLDLLWKDLKSLQNEDLIIHFRLATHGDCIEEFTHPFVVSSDIIECTSVSIETDKRVLVHNGIISNFGSKELSDTVDFTTRILSKIESIEDSIKILELTGSKFVLIDNLAKDFHLVGDFHNYKGLLVSNLYFTNSFNHRIYFDDTPCYRDVYKNSEDLEDLEDRDYFLDFEKYYYKKGN